MSKTERFLWFLEYHTLADLGVTTDKSFLTSGINPSISFYCAPLGLITAQWYGMK